MSDEGTRSAGAYAVVRQNEPQVYLAESAQLLNRVLALHVVAQLPGTSVGSDSRLAEMRTALLEERWGDALIAWIEETGVEVDVYTGPITIWSEARLDEEQASFEMRLAPLFDDRES